MSKLPNLTTDKEVTTWFDTHDTPDYIDEMEMADEIFPVIRTEFTTHPLDLRLRTDFLDAIETLAEQRGIPYQLLIQRWLREKLVQKAPELLTQSS